MPAKCAAPRATAHLSQEYRTPAWEQRKLGELTEIKDSARIPNRLWREAGVPYIRASDISQEDLRGALFIDEEDYAAYKAATGAPEKGDVLFNGGGEIGKAIINGNSSPIYVQGGAVLYARIAHSSLLDARYLVAAFVTQNVVNAIGVLSAGGTMKHFTLQPAKNLPIEVPSIAEQRRIGAFFDRLDSLITLHQRKYDKLCVLKKSMLDKMFPKGGSLYPEIRFAGFTDPWEQRKLSSTCEQLSRTINPLETPNEEFTEYSMPAFDNNETAETVIGNSMNSLRKIVDRPCLLVNKLNVRKKRIWHVPRPEANAVCSSEFVPFSSHSSDLSFIKISLLSERITAYLESCSSGSSNSQKRVTPEIIMSSEIIAPSLAEQRRIGAFFDRLDSLITLHQRKLELLRNIKKSMLDKMFV